MKIAYINNNVVIEIIPDYALPVEKWYGEAFASQCVEVPDEVEQNWVYDPETGTFVPEDFYIPTPSNNYDEFIAGLMEGYQNG